MNENSIKDEVQSRKRGRMRKLKDVMRKVSVTLMIVAMVASVIPLSKVFAGSGNAQGAAQGSPGKNVAAKIVDVTYVFKSKTAGKNLPQEVEKLKPCRNYSKTYRT